jgi:lysozyme family protein
MNKYKGFVNTQTVKDIQKILKLSQDGILGESTRKGIKDYNSKIKSINRMNKIKRMFK